jgi:hypothetical protein
MEAISSSEMFVTSTRLYGITTQKTALLKLRVFENNVLRRIFGNEENESM